MQTIGEGTASLLFGELIYGNSTGAILEHVRLNWVCKQELDCSIY
jgi:hypothetical protein